MNPREIKPTTPRDGVWTSSGLSAEFRHVYSHPKSPGWHRVQTASGEHYAHESELQWDHRAAKPVLTPDGVDLIRSICERIEDPASGKIDPAELMAEIGGKW